MPKWLLPVTVALVIRVGLAISLPDSSRYAADTVYYERLALNLLAGNGFSSDLEEPHLPSIERPPGYPALMAIAWLPFGKSYGVLGAVQILLDVLAVYWIWAAGKRRFGLKAAQGAALVYAMVPFTAGTSLQFMSEGPATSLVALAGYMQTRAWDTDDRRVGGAWAVGCGLAWGVAALFRSYLAPLAAVTGVVAAWEGRAARGGRGALLSFVAVGVGSALPVSCWVARNAYVAATTTQPFVLLERFGSRPEFIKMYTPGFRAWYKSYDEPFLWLERERPPRASYLDEAEQREVADLWQKINDNGGATPPEADAAFARIARERYERAPLRTYVWRPISVALKFWMSPRASTLRLSLGKAGALRKASRLLVVVFLGINLLIVAFALLGIWTKGRRTEGVYLWAVPLALTVVLTVIVHRESRLTMPMFPIVTLAAGVGIVAAPTLWGRWRAGSQRSKVS